jgi:hypothetical protein
MASKKVVNKKIVVTSNLNNLSETELEKSFDKLQTAAANAPGGLVLNPTPAAVLTQINARKALITDRENHLALAKQDTENIGKADTTLKNIFTSQWANQIQNFAGITVAQIKAMAYGVKGISGGTAETTSVMEMSKTVTSAPVIVKVDTDVIGEQIAHIHNNITGKRGHGKDILRVDVYAQYGGTLPANLAALQAAGGQLLGTAERGVYINPIVTTAANKNTNVYYIAVYVGKKTKKIVAQSVVFTAVIK